jgi:hypothetical protein
MRCTRTQTAKVHHKLGRIKEAVEAERLRLTTYERETTSSISDQIDRGMLVSVAQKMFVDELYKRVQETLHLSMLKPATTSLVFSLQDGREPE